MRKLLLAMILALPLATIGSTTDEVDFDAFPNSPIVFLNDVIDGGGEDARTIKGPWYLGGFTIVNHNTSYYLYVPFLRVIYRATEGGPILGETTIDIGDVCKGMDNPVRSLYAVLEPAPSASTPTAFFGDANCDGVNNGVSDRELIYFEALPKNDSTIYHVTVELEGFYYDPNSTDDPIKSRVRKTLEFVTQ